MKSPNEWYEKAAEEILVMLEKLAERTPNDPLQGASGLKLLGMLRTAGYRKAFAGIIKEHVPVRTYCICGEELRHHETGEMHQCSAQKNARAGTLFLEAVRFLKNDC